MTDEASFEELLAQHDACAKKLQPGQKVSGTVIAIGAENVFIDVGLKQDGVLDRAEILDADGNEKVAQGDTVEAWVTGISPQGISLSRSMTGSGVAALEEAKDAGIPVEGRIKGACKGGYEVEVMGKAAFCPGSQMENLGPDEDPAGRQMQFLITRIENHGRNIVVSRRALLEREKKENLDKLLSSINIGDIVEGKVSRLAPYGAFVELAPQVEGLIHISELGWSRVSSPDEVVTGGDPVRVKIVDIVKDDKGQMRISLSAKQATGDPWLEVENRFKPGDIVTGVVRRLAPFGAFVEIAPGIEGLAHISELSWERRIAKPEDLLAPGDSVSVKIKEISPETRKLSLSMRDAAGDPWEALGEEFVSGARMKGTVESRSQHGVFVKLAPGIIGLLPQAVLARNSGVKLPGLNPGEAIEVVIKNVDPAARRISLQLPDAADGGEERDESWRKHQSVSAPEGAGGLDIMAQAFARAIQKK